MDGEKNATVATDGDVTDRFRVRQHFLERVAAQDRRRGKVRVRLATTVSHPEHDRPEERDDHKEQQDVLHMWLLCPVT